MKKAGGPAGGPAGISIVAGALFFAPLPSVISNSSVVAGTPDLISDWILGKSCRTISLLISFTLLFKTLLEIVSERGGRLLVGGHVIADSIAHGAYWKAAGIGGTRTDPGCYLWELKKYNWRRRATTTAAAAGDDGRERLLLRGHRLVVRAINSDRWDCVPLLLISCTYISCVVMPRCQHMSHGRGRELSVQPSAERELTLMHRSRIAFRGRGGARRSGRAPVRAGTAHL